jgi:hypothetical protein
MDGFGTYPVKDLRPGPVHGAFRFATNGTSDPSLTTMTGSMKNLVTTNTYSATGVYTIVFDAGFTFADFPVWIPQAHCADQSTNAFIVVVQSWTASTRTLVLQLLKPDTAAWQASAPPSAGTNNWVQVAMFAVNSGGL